MSEILILITLGFFIFTSPYLAKVLKIPVSPTEIILGIIAGNLGLLYANPTFDFASKIGFYYLMFLAGAEVDFRFLFKISRQILKKSLLFLALLYILGAILVAIFDLPNLIIIAVPLMSVGLLSTLYKDYGKDEEWLNLAMLVGVLGEIVSIVALSVVGIYLKDGFGASMLLKIGSLVGFIGAIALVFKSLEMVFWWYPSLKTIIMPHYDKNEKDIRFAMAIFCLICASASWLDIEIFIAAFIAGAFLPTFFSHKEGLVPKLSSFGFGFIVPIFFIHTGAAVELDALLMPGVLKFCLLLAGIMIFTRILCAGVFWEILRARAGALFALSLSMPLTLLIATATLFFEANFISKEIYYAMIVASLIEALVCMIGINLIYNRTKQKS
ncbi:MULTISPECIES: cation:proton antiporter [unclassified Campylobacter]|uniref:cation:proton antiporter n=1 Tax=unclassified Campylobacter TaxID=2593542 RepID=UPI0022E9D944|nr:MULTISPECIES: cation:proton antiporter [unclassified Campylobacter]MDA3043963.1 cation:proton antiporter [Campylobacter sp. JMF_09 ED2]MDA3045528.1 cation:proton antiporter [Campylobacter sp. JMF_07 ED4]MDA3064627.1 cation:proton antiporter [Campylobacter sp. JMF_11 EL3]MDA3072544.1 cation:proton antiporter [Campylobacter sp. VBCF_03 NA9]MDA3075687.1 cation:proton antiporter [Campylobacter sp. JMF_05 ED3]